MENVTNISQGSQENSSSKLSMRDRLALWKKQRASESESPHGKSNSSHSKAPAVRAESGASARASAPAKRSTAAPKTALPHTAPKTATKSTKEPSRKLAKQSSEKVPSKAIPTSKPKSATAIASRVAKKPSAKRPSKVGKKPAASAATEVRVPFEQRVKLAGLAYTSGNPGQGRALLRDIVDDTRFWGRLTEPLLWETWASLERSAGALAELVRVVEEAGTYGVLVPLDVGAADVPSKDSSIITRKDEESAPPVTPSRLTGARRVSIDSRSHAQSPDEDRRSARNKAHEQQNVTMMLESAAFAYAPNAALQGSNLAQAVASSAATSQPKSLAPTAPAAAAPGAARSPTAPPTPSHSVLRDVIARNSARKAGARKPPTPSRGLVSSMISRFENARSPAPMTPGRARRVLSRTPLASPLSAKFGGAKRVRCTGARATPLGSGKPSAKKVRIASPEKAASPASHNRDMPATDAVSCEPSLDAYLFATTDADSSPQVQPSPAPEPSPAAVAPTAMLDDGITWQPPNDLVGAVFADDDDLAPRKLSFGVGESSVLSPAAITPRRRRRQSEAESLLAAGLTIGTPASAKRMRRIA